MRKMQIGGLVFTLLSFGVAMLSAVISDKKMEKVIAEEVEKAVDKKLGS